MMKYYTAEKNEQSTAIHNNTDKYQIIMLNEKNMLHKNTYRIIPFTKNKAKSYICSGRAYVC